MSGPKSLRGGKASDQKEIKAKLKALEARFRPSLPQGFRDSITSRWIRHSRQLESQRVPVYQAGKGQTQVQPAQLGHAASKVPVIHSGQLKQRATIMAENVLVDNNYPDIFICELTRIERLGANRRLIFTVPDPTSPAYKTIVAKLIVPADYMSTLAN